MARAPKTDGKPLDFQPRPGEPGPFSGYTLGAPYDEMFARDPRDANDRQTFVAVVEGQRLPRLHRSQIDCRLVVEHPVP